MWHNMTLKQHETHTQQKWRPEVDDYRIHSNFRGMNISPFGRVFRVYNFAFLISRLAAWLSTLV